MSDTLADNATVSDVTAPAVADPSPAPVESAPAADVQSAPDFSFNDADYNQLFGLEPEVKETPVAEQSAPTTEPDVKAPDQPATRQGEEPVATPEPEAPKAEESDKDAKDGQFAPNEKLNWDTAPKHFREEHKTLKEAFMTLAEGHPQVQYLQDPSAFATWMKETSPTSYTEVGKLLATESAASHPKEWAEYLYEKNPDILAEIVTGKEGMTADKLKAELSLLSDEDEPDVQALIEKQKATAAETKKEETPQEKQVRELLEKEAAREYQEAFQQVSGPIESAVNELVSQAGLEADFKALQQQDFTKLSEDDQFKFVVNQGIPHWIEQRIQADPRLASMQARMEHFLAVKDEKGNPKKPDVQSAMNLLHPLRIAVTNFTNEYLAAMTGKRAQAKQAEVAPPTQPPPAPPQVKSAGAGQQAFTAPPTGEIDWSGSM